MMLVFSSLVGYRYIHFFVLNMYSKYRIRQSHGGDIGKTMGYVGIGCSDRVIAGAQEGLGVIHLCNLRDANR